MFITNNRRCAILALVAAGISSGASAVHGSEIVPESRESEIMLARSELRDEVGVLGELFYGPDGAIEIVGLEEVDPNKVEPGDYFQLYSISEDGECVPGVVYTSCYAIGVHALRYPGALIWNGSEWKIKYRIWRTVDGSRDFSSGYAIPGSEKMHVWWSFESNAVRSDGGTTENDYIIQRAVLLMLGR